MWEVEDSSNTLLKEMIFIKIDFPKMKESKKVSSGAWACRKVQQQYHYCFVKMYSKTLITFKMSYSWCLILVSDAVKVELFNIDLTSYLIWPNLSHNQSAWINQLVSHIGR